MKTTDKRQEAKLLYTKFVPFEFKTFDYTDHYGWKRQGHVCIVNSVRFVRSGDLSLTDAIRQFLAKGLITRDDVIPGKQVGEGRTFTGRPCILLKLPTLKKLKKEFVEENMWSNADEFDEYIKKAEEVEDPPLYNFPLQKQSEIWEIYEKRQQLILEGTRERKEEKMREEMREAGYTSDDSDNPKDELAELVDRIEAMGWHVTLTRKEGA